MRKPQSEWLSQPSQEEYDKCDISSNAVKAVVLEVSTSNLEVVYRVASKGETWLAKLRRVVFFLKCVRRWKEWPRRPKRITRATVPLSPVSMEATWQEFRVAEIAIFNAVQRKSFSVEFHQLVDKNVAVPNVRKEKKLRTAMAKSQIWKFNPFVDADGSIRIGSRLSGAEVEFGAKFPLILPKKEVLVRAWVRYLHVKDLHAGAKFVTSVSRQTAWIFMASRR